jgi:plastocyanin
MAFVVGAALLAAAVMIQWTAFDARAATVGVQADETNQFSPQQVTISVGDSVRWTVVGNIPHDVTADGDAFADSGTMSDGDTHTVTFNTAGTFGYVCTIHLPDMTGTVIVQAAPTATNTSGAPTATRTSDPSSTPSRTATGTVTVAPSATAIATATPVPATPFVAAPISATEPSGGAAGGIAAPQTGAGTETDADSGFRAEAIAAGIAGFALMAASAAVSRRRS